VFRKILYATDFSENSRSALRHVMDLKGAGAEEVVVMHVIDDRSPYPLTAIDMFAIQKGWEESAASEMAAIEEKIVKHGLSVRARIERGVPFREIVKAAEEEDVSLIVLGSHGKDDITEMLLGSVAEKVARKSKRTVLIVRNRPGQTFDACEVFYGT
jgi:nucleotide-binding universal stress UspA family protein